jgi:cell division ATPase FtsA
VSLTGGGILVPGSVDLAKRKLRLPAQIGYPKPFGGILDQVDSPASATVVGLLLLSEEEGDMRERFSFGGATKFLGRIPGDWGGIAGKAKGMFRRFLP